MSAPKYPVKFMEQKKAKGSDKRYLQLTNDVTVHGYTRKDGTKTPDQFFPKYSFVELVEKPTDEQVIEASNKSEKAGAYLEKRAQNWGEFTIKEYQVQPKKEDNR